MFEQEKPEGVRKIEERAARYGYKRLWPRWLSFLIQIAGIERDRVISDKLGLDSPTRIGENVFIQKKTKGLPPVLRRMAYYIGLNRGLKEDMSKWHRGEQDEDF